MTTTAPSPRRALIMAGGGLKVAFQAGVLQVWLDEARTADGKPLIFDLADGASGGVFNLAMWCQGLSGHEIADRWRRFRPLEGISLNWRRWFPVPLSVFSYDAFRRHVLHDAWGLDWERIRTTSRTATFNLFDVSRQRHEVRTAAEMTEDALVSAVSLPMWFPPVEFEGSTYIDAVYATDANLQAAIDRGADELWVIWTVSQRGQWRPGFVPEYFQVIEAAANSRVRAMLERIERSNAADGGRSGEFGRHLEVKWLSAEVPAHYLFNVTRAGMAEAVDRGVAQGRAWCLAHGLVVDHPAPPDGGGRVTFAEKMSGTFGFGTAGAESGPASGPERDTALAVRLRVAVPPLEGFLADQHHRAQLSGEVRCEALGGVRPLVGGEVELLTDDGDPYRKRLTYRLLFTDSADQLITLIGNKTVVHQAHRDDLWPDTSTLAVELYRGDQLAAVPGSPGPEQAHRLGHGVLRLSPVSFAHQLTTFRATAGDRGGAGRTLFTFAQFFLRQLWQVYTHSTTVELAPQYVPPGLPAPDVAAPRPPSGPADAAVAASVA
ncbi:MAG: patatin-like phospholipase family protein [Propionibacteriaceae bacterium]